MQNKKYAFLDHNLIWMVEFKEDNEFEVSKLTRKCRGWFDAVPADLNEFAAKHKFNRPYYSMSSKLVFQCLGEHTIILDLYSNAVIDQNLVVTPINWDEHQELLKLITTLAI